MDSLMNRKFIGESFKLNSWTDDLVEQILQFYIYSFVITFDHHFTLHTKSIPFDFNKVDNK